MKKLAKCLDKSGVVRTVLMELSKACDCLPQYLLLEKLSAYGFDESAITLIANYLSNRYQRVKIGPTFGSYLEILRGVPQSSILAPILFNLFINDLIFSIQETEVVNPRKFQIMFLGSNIDNSKITFMIENKRVKSRSEVKLLGITIDDKLSFTTHIENLCSTTSNRLRALARIRKFISFEQAKRLSEAYIMSTFTYCPLIWMFRSKTASNLINKIHKHSLRVIYEMGDANFEDLLIKYSSWTIHEINIHTLLIEIYESLNHISSPIMQEFFDLKVTPYSLRNNNLLRSPKTNTS